MGILGIEYEKARTSFDMAACEFDRALTTGVMDSSLIDRLIKASDKMTEARIRKYQAA